MPDWRVNALEGIYKFGAAYPMQKRYQILADYATHGSFAVSARENRVSYNTARAICEKFIATGDCQADAESRFLSWSVCELFFPNWRTCWTVTGMSVLVGINVKAAVWSARRFLALSRATSLFCAIFEQSGHWQLRNGQAECAATLKLWALHLLQNLFMLHVSDGSDIMNFLARDNFSGSEKKILEKWRARNRQGKRQQSHVINLARHFTHAR